MSIINNISSFFLEYSNYWDSWSPIFLSASKSTLIITIGAFLVSNVFGIVVACFRLSDFWFLSKLAVVYIELFRSVPTLVLLFMLYYGIAPLGIVIDPVPAAILALGLAAGAHMAEIFRSGIEGVHRGQREAGMAVGLTPFQSFRHIVFPQAMRISLAPSINMLIVILKDSSLASLISVPEIMLSAKQIISTDFLPLHALLMAGAIYLIFGIMLSKISGKLKNYSMR